MLNKKIFLPIFLIFLYLSCQNQTTIKGEVFYKSGDETVKVTDHTVKIFKNEKDIATDTYNYSAVTNADGKFQLKIPNGKYFLVLKTLKDADTPFEFEYLWSESFNADGEEKVIILSPSNAKTRLTKRKSF